MNALDLDDEHTERDSGWAWAGGVLFAVGTLIALSYLAHLLLG
jgi:hypothetical protein